ncbi:chaplin [Streptomyces sp. NPDC006610]|uniref:chaplin n=1 Tax=Streptomyces sp. NPDC006610 TaxID=3154584 RepID=UPI0033BA5198
MKRATRNRVLAVAVASGAMAAAFPAHLALAADGGASADGAAVGSPGAASGNTVQVPLHVPVNVCGNTVSVVGLLNPAAGNRCVNDGGDAAGREGGAGAHAADGPARDRAGAPADGASADGLAAGSPGVLSGNAAQLPVDVPVNITGNSVNVGGIGNPAVGNESVNGPDSPARPAEPEPDPEPVAPPKTPPAPAAPEPHAPAPEVALAETGADALLPAAVGATAAVLGGAALFRRFRPGATR